LRIGDVALHAAHRELARQRAAAAVLDHVAQALHRGWLADDAAVEPLAARLQGFDEAHRAVDRGPFLIAGDEEGDAATMLPMRLHEALAGDDHRRQRGLHVSGAAAIEL